MRRIEGEIDYVRTGLGTFSVTSGEVNVCPVSFKFHPAFRKEIVGTYRDTTKPYKKMTPLANYSEDAASKQKL